MKFNYKIFNDTDMVAEIKNSGIYFNRIEPIKNSNLGYSSFIGIVSKEELLQYKGCFSFICNLLDQENLDNMDDLYSILQNTELKHKPLKIELELLNDESEALTRTAILDTSACALVTNIIRAKDTDDVDRVIYFAYN